MSLEDDLATNDEARRKRLKPLLAPDEVESILRVHYAGSEQESVRVVRQLDSYDDVNYLVEVERVNFLFKVHNGVESEDFLQKSDPIDFYNSVSSVIHFQVAILEALQAQNIPSYRSVPPVGKSSPVLVKALPVVSGERYDLVIRLLTWVEGHPMSGATFLPIESLVDAGYFLGRMDHALDTMSSSHDTDHTDWWTSSSLLEPGRRFHQWDGKNTGELRKFLCYIHDDKRRCMVESIVDAFDSALARHAEFRVGVNHADFNDANIIVGSDLRVVGVIDFGDSVESWRVLDVSVAMAYAMLSKYGSPDRMISAAAALLRGYHTVYPLLEDERKHLVLLICCRLACSVTLGAYSLKQNPGNRYLLMHAEPAWKALELLWGYDSDRRHQLVAQASTAFERACDARMEESDQKYIPCCDLAFPDPFVPDIFGAARSSVTVSADKELRTSRRPTVTFVTGNRKKLVEVQRILGNGPFSPFELLNQKIDLPELQGEPVEITRSKCVAAAQALNCPVIIEDTSLCFSALNGLPGPYIKWFLESMGHDGLNQLLSGFEDKTGYARTIVAFCLDPAHEPIVFDGRTTGKIVPPRGTLDFGWDPIFEPDEGQGLTYAEMSKTAKDSISHRSRAFAKLRAFLEKEETLVSLAMIAMR